MILQQSSRPRIMGRKTHMACPQPSTPVRARSTVLFLLGLLVLLSGCSLESPISTTDRPLAERLETRRAAAERAQAESTTSTVATTTTSEVVDPDEAPEGLAFVEVDERTALIIGSPLGLTMRAGPGQGYDLLVAIPSDAVIVATGSRTGEWDHVRYGALEGWVKHRFIVDAPADAVPSEGINDVSVRTSGVPYVVVGKGNGGGVNVRSEPDVNASLVFALQRGTEIRATGATSGPWIEVEYNGKRGWSWAAYVAPL